MSKISLGNWFGFPVSAHWSMIIIALLVPFHGWEIAISYFVGFVLVILHECGHCIAAKMLGYHTEYIILFPFGGLAGMEIPTKQSHEILVSLAGPLVNLIFAYPLWWLNQMGLIYDSILVFNLGLLIFNLLPAFPMDGGRVLRAVLAWFLTRKNATRVAVRISQVLCLVFLFIGIYAMNLSLCIIAFLIGLMAEHELKEFHD